MIFLHATLARLFNRQSAPELFAGGVAVIAGSVLVLAWGMDVVALRRVHPGFAAMVPGTAFSLLAIAVAFLTSMSGRPGATRLTRRVCAGVTLVVLANLGVMMLTPFSGIEDALIGGWADGDSMAVATCVSLLLAAFATARLTRPRDLPDLPFEIAAMLGLALSLVALAGYLFDSNALYGVFLFTAMALHTAISFALLFLALLLARPELGCMRILLGSGRGSVGARRLLPLVVIAPIAVCFIALKMTEAGYLTPNFRASLLAIAMVAVLVAAVLRNAALENRAEARMLDAMEEMGRISADRALLLREVYHRVKNNMQQINAILRIESRKMDDPALSRSYADVADRVRAMGIVHQMLISAPSPSEVEAAEFLKSLVEGLKDSQKTGARGIDITVEAEPMRAHLDIAVSLGLLTNELLTNAVRHRLGPAGGRIVIRLFRDGDDLVLGVDDTGRNFDGDASIDDGQGTAAVLIRTMVAQLKGRLDVTRRPGATGTRVEVRMPADINERDRYE